MSIRALLIAVAIYTLAACASTVGERDALGNPKLDRLSAEQVARLGPAHPRKLSVDDIVRLSREGVPPQQIIDRYYHSGTRLKLKDAQLTELRQRGVDQRVVDYIVQAEIQAETTDRITAQADREASERARRELERSYRYYDPWWEPYYGWGPRVYPYFGYGWSRWGSGWYGGLGIGF